MLTSSDPARNFPGDFCKLYATNNYFYYSNTQRHKAKLRV